MTRIEAHNAKARKSTAGSRKKGKRKTLKSEDPTQHEPKLTGIDSNAAIIIPKTKEEKEREVKLKLRQEIAAASEAKWTSKKKKRLEKYIDTKLKKEERVQILQKLAQSQAELPTTLDLQSSSTLGTGRVTTNRERHDRLEDKEIRRVMDGTTSGSKRKRFKGDIYAVEEADDSNDDDHALASIEEDGADTRDMAIDLPPPPVREQVTIVDSSDMPAVSQAAPIPAAVGSALKRNADGTAAAPKVRKKGPKTAFQSWKRQSQIDSQPQEEDSDTSFDSSDSAFDTSESEDAADSSDEESVPDGKEEDEAPSEPPKKKSFGFKDWAMKQLHTSKGYDLPKSLEETPDTDFLPSPTKKRKLDHSKPTEMRGPLGEDLKLPKSAFADQLSQPGSSRTKSVLVQRPSDVEEARLLLPIVTEEQPIMEAIRLNPVVIICGETGSGKTTQVPQFLYEAGFGHPDSENPGMIGITQPRRVAAMSMASRVAHELSLTSSQVSYQIRYDATVSPSTTIKFMTDGVLLRELATDFLLTKYSVITIDEAHERSMNTDILIGVLSRVIKLREDMWKDKKAGAKPLRLIIMSATLRVSDFAENKALFPSPPPVINVAARQHPVTVHFNRRTPSDYVTEAIKKASKIHARLPPGGILIFMTGQNEITGVCRKLEARYGKKALEDRRKKRGQKLMSFQNDENSSDKDNRVVMSNQVDIEAEDIDLGNTEDLALDVDDGIAEEDDDALDSDDDELDQELGINIDDDVDVPMHIVPLYSLLPSEKQMLVFKPPPEGSRLVVVSTNVAETSLTIPGIRYVVDCGRAKERRYDVANGMQSFQVSWTSKASAAQRAGRAGRTGPGHCYRLYSSALFEHYFDQFSQPEILRMPIEGVVLQMKSMHIDSVINFPFPTPPDRFTLHKAEKTLIHLGALAPQTALVDGKTVTENKITGLGKAMSLFPLSPRFSRMLVSGQQRDCLPYVIAIVSALSVGDPFLREESIGTEDGDDSNDDSDSANGATAKARAKEAKRSLRKAFFQSQHIHSSLGSFSSDDFRILSVVGAYEYAGGGSKFCQEHFVRPKAMEEIHKLRAQISNIVHLNFNGIDAKFEMNLGPPNEKQLKVLKQLLTAGFIDQVAVRKDRIERGSTKGEQYSTTKGVPYRAMGINEDVYIHPSSVLAGRPPPEYVIYHEIVRTSRPWLKGITGINPAWLASLGKSSLCTFSKPVKNNEGTPMVIPRFGPDGWELPAVKASTIQ